jgi:hypothetical protein
MVSYHLADHLPNRVRLTAAPRDVAGLKPIETAVRVIGALLLRQQQNEAEPISERRPSCPEIITSRTLCASVQNDDEAALFRDLRRQVDEHAQVARVGPEIPDFPEVT